MTFANQQAIAKIKTRKRVCLQLQAAIREIRIAKIVRCGSFMKYMSCENLYAYGIAY